MMLSRERTENREPGECARAEKSSLSKHVARHGDALRRVQGSCAALSAHVVQGRGFAVRCSPPPALLGVGAGAAPPLVDPPLDPDEELPLSHVPTLGDRGSAPRPDDAPPCEYPEPLITRPGCSLCDGVVGMIVIGEPPVTHPPPEP